MTQSVKVVRLPILEKNPNRIRTRLIFIYLSSSLRVIRSRLVLITSRKNQSINHFFAGFRWCGTVDQFLLCGQWNFALSNTFSTKRASPRALAAPMWCMEIRACKTTTKQPGSNNNNPKTRAVTSKKTRQLSKRSTHTPFSHAGSFVMDFFFLLLLHKLCYAPDWGW